MTWYCLRVRHDIETARRLELDEVCVYQPLLRVVKTARHVKSRARRTYEALVPLFPGYVFVRDPEWGSVRRWTGVIGFVGNAEGVARSIEDSEIAWLMSRMVGGGLEVGVRVTIMTGPFEGLKGIVVAIEHGMRVRVSVDGGYNVLVPRDLLAY